MMAVSACSTNPDPGAGDLTVFAAASLRTVFEDLATAWETGHPGSELAVATNGSNILAAQISEGAPADVFISADRELPRQLVDAGRTAADEVSFMSNRITLVAPVAGDAVRTPADLAAPGTRLVAAGPGVPITRYAEETLAQLAAQMPDPDAFSEAVAANVVTREDNVRAALAKVELGEGDAAFVYSTDALSSDRVREVPLPDAIDVVADYVAVQLSDRPIAAEFVTWLQGREAGRILAAAGFEMART